MPLRVAFHTLGCKLNQLETESFADAFAREGAVVLPHDKDEGDADLVIVNTCTVTGKADRRARQIVRRALACNPTATAIVTGCYAQVEAALLAALDPRALVLPGERKSALLGLPAWLGHHGEDDCADLLVSLREWLSTADAGTSGLGCFAFNPESFAYHSRPSLKVQDGCDNSCAYCRVSIARGRSVSLPAGLALERARALEAAGRAEIVLTGVNLSQYRDGDMDFPALLNYLIAGTERIAFRLTSYEPDRVDDAFVDAFANARVRPHVHLAVQSGSDAVLAAMGRGYGRERVITAVDSLRRARRDPFIAADLIAGFPGETEADAAATIEMARRCDFAWIQAFRFSPRPGTRAAALADCIPERVAVERAEELLRVGTANRASYVERWTGATVSAVLEAGTDRMTGVATADNYLKLRVLGIPGGGRPGQPVACTIESARGGPLPVSVDAFALYIDPKPRGSS